MQPHDAAVGQLAELDEIAQLVGEPEAPAARRAELGAHAADQRLREIRPLSRTSQITDRPSSQTRRMPGPPPWRTLLVATSCAESTSRGTREAGTAGAPRLAARKWRRSAERVAGDLVLGRRRRRVGQRRGELRQRRGHRGRRGLGEPATRTDGWPASAITSPSRRLGVVGADQVEVGGVGEGGVEQRLVALALDQLGRGCDRPRSAPRSRASGAPRRSSKNSCQAGMMRAGLAPRLGHVGERDPVGVLAQPRAQEVDPRRAPIATMIGPPAATASRDERRGAVDERVGAVVEHGLVPEAADELHTRQGTRAPHAVRSWFAMSRRGVVALVLAARAGAAGGRARPRSPGHSGRLTGTTTLPLVYYQGVTADPAQSLYFDGVFVGLYRSDVRVRRDRPQRRRHPARGPPARGLQPHRRHLLGPPRGRAHPAAAGVLRPRRAERRQPLPARLDRRGGAGLAAVALLREARPGRDPEGDVERGLTRRCAAVDLERRRPARLPHRRHHARERRARGRADPLRAPAARRRAAERDHRRDVRRRADVRGGAGRRPVPRLVDRPRHRRAAAGDRAPDRGGVRGTS